MKKQFNYLFIIAFVLVGNLAMAQVVPINPQQGPKLLPHGNPRWTRTPTPSPKPATIHYVLKSAIAILKTGNDDKDGDSKFFMMCALAKNFTPIILENKNFGNASFAGNDGTGSVYFKEEGKGAHYGGGGADWQLNLNIIQPPLGMTDMEKGSVIELQLLDAEARFGSDNWNIKSLKFIFTFVNANGPGAQKTKTLYIPALTLHGHNHEYVAFNFIGNKGNFTCIQ